MKSLGEEMLLFDTLGNQKNQFSTLVEILQHRASLEPAKIAYTYLANGETPEDRLTYQQLDCKAKAIAAYLQSCISPGDRALLIYPQGLEFIAAFFGCLYAGVIAIPTPAPEASRLKRIRPRLESIIQDAECSFILSTSKALSELELFIADYKNLKTLSYIATNTINHNLEQDWKETPIKSDSLAYLQYTSGSTSAPKGVIITHQNLIENLSIITQAHGYTSESICASWIPYFHDYGLVNGILQPLYAGIPCFIMSPMTFIKHPIRWLSAISKYHVTHTGAPCFAYRYCLEKINLDDCQNLNLSSWRIAHTGAETIRRETLELFTDKFNSYGFNFSAFYPSYGLAEATLMVTTKKADESPKFCTVSRQILSDGRVVIEEKNELENVVSLTSCGISRGDTKLAIVNPETLTKCGVDEVGEIWVAGSSVAKGYWQRLDLTEKTFQAYITDTKEGPFLRTGDLGFIKDGELFVSGRLKDLIIIRGRNYYPQDIEWIVEKSHPALRISCCAVFSIEIKKVEQLVIAAEIEGYSNKNLALDEVVKAIRNGVAEHQELAVYGVVLLKRSTIPKTSSGKIQRQACRAAYLDGSLDSIAIWTLDTATSEKYEIPQNEYEFRLMQIWQQVLEINTIGIKDNFFEWGGNSLKAAELMAIIEKKFNQTLRISALLENPTIEQLAARLNQPEWGQNERSLVAIKPGGSKRPFFYVHPRSGTLLLAGNLGRYMDAERPFYGLQSIGLDGKQQPYTRIEDMAAHYIKEIQTIQPIGPYLIGGRCIGGLIALEMAQQLLAQGKKVLRVVIVETPRTRIVDPVLAQKIQKNMKKMRESNSVQANYFQKVMNANDEAGKHYQAKIYPGQIAYFAAEKTIHDASSGFGWANLARGGLEIVEVPGDHMSVTEEPNVQVFAEKLNACLDEAERKNRSFQLQQIQADLEISRNRLSQIKAGL